MGSGCPGGVTPDTLGPWLNTTLDGQAAEALEAFDIENMTVEGGEEVVLRDFDEKFPDKVAADRIGEATEEALS